MISIRTVRITAVTLVAALLLAAVAAAADGPTTTVSASISPNKVSFKNGRGTPVRLNFNIAISHPADSRAQLQRVVILFPKGSHTNGKLFKSCSAATLNRARGNLSACPKGSKVGTGLATGTAVDLGVTSSGRMTLFNGPGGKSITLNVSILNPAQINTTFQAPLTKASGKYAYRLTFNVPPSLQTILGGPIVVRSIRTTTAAYKVVNGVRRGFLEAGPCPKNHKAPLHADFGFSDGSTPSSDATITCK